MHTITRRFTFDAAHRVLGHEGKCRHLHGHRYVAEVTVKASELNRLGMVIDFSVIKERVGGWIDEHLDHNIILNPADPLVALLLGSKVQRPYVMMASAPNPTAENIAQVIYECGVDSLPDSITVVVVKLWETDNCYAVFRPPTLPLSA